MGFLVETAFKVTCPLVSFYMLTFGDSSVILSSLSALFNTPTFTLALWLPVLLTQRASVCVDTLAESASPSIVALRCLSRPRYQGGSGRLKGKEPSGSLPWGLGKVTQESKWRPAPGWGVLGVPPGPGWQDGSGPAECTRVTAARSLGGHLLDVSWA